MTIAQRRNASMQQLNSADLLPVENKNFAAEWYDASSESFTSAEVLTFATERLNTAPTIFSYSGGVVTLAEAGVYIINFRVVLQSAGSTGDGEAAIYLEEDPDTGVFATVVGTAMYAAIPQFLRQSAQFFTILRVGIDYRYRVSAIRTSGVDAITTTGTRVFSISRLFKNG